MNAQKNNTTSIYIWCPTQSRVMTPVFDQCQKMQNGAFTDPSNLHAIHHSDALQSSKLSSSFALASSLIILPCISACFMKPLPIDYWCLLRLNMLGLSVISSGVVFLVKARDCTACEGSSFLSSGSFWREKLWLRDVVLILLPLFFFILSFVSEMSAVSYTHLTLPTRRTV